MLDYNNNSLADNIDKIYHLEPKIKRAFILIDRKYFVPKGMKHLAYKLEPLPIIEEQWLSSPLSVAKMTTILDLNGVDSVLEIGCGSGYQSAILSRIVRRVFTIERIKRLYLEAKERFKFLSLTNINVRYGDGLNGWQQFAPYDRILFSASLSEIPNKVILNLKEGGYLVAPIEKKNGEQNIIRFIKLNNRLYLDKSFDKCQFVPIKSLKN